MRSSHTIDSFRDCHSLISSHLPSSRLLPLELRQPSRLKDTVSGVKKGFCMTISLYVPEWIIALSITTLEEESRSQSSTH